MYLLLSVAIIAHHFLDKYNRKYNSNKRITPGGFKILYSHPFPGNVRELDNLLRQAVVMIEKSTLDEAVINSLLSISESKLHSKDDRKNLSGLKEQLDATEKVILKDAMQEFHSTREIARALKTSHSTIVRKLQKYGLVRSYGA